MRQRNPEAKMIDKSKWFCYESMMFLKDRNKPRGTIDTEVSI